MKMYFSPTTVSFYPEEFLKDYKNIPKDVVEIPNDQWVTFGLSNPPLNKVRGVDEAGKLVWVDAPEAPANFIISNEKEWVQRELDYARDELEKVQDSDQKAVGTVTEWRNYRKQLRAWVDDVNFPDPIFRPKSPKN